MSTLMECIAEILTVFGFIMIRFDKITKMSLDEMAQFINEMIEYMGWCTSSEEDICHGKHCIQCVKKWLNEKVE